MISGLGSNCAPGLLTSSVPSGASRLQRLLQVGLCQWACLGFHLGAFLFFFTLTLFFHPGSVTHLGTPFFHLGTPFFSPWNPLFSPWNPFLACMTCFCAECVVIARWDAAFLDICQADDLMALNETSHVGGSDCKRAAPRHSTCFQWLSTRLVHTSGKGRLLSVWRLQSHALPLFHGEGCPPRHPQVCLDQASCHPQFFFVSVFWSTLDFFLTLSHSFPLAKLDKSRLATSSARPVESCMGTSCGPWLLRICKARPISNPSHPTRDRFYA